MIGDGAEVSAGAVVTKDGEPRARFVCMRMPGGLRLLTIKGREWYNCICLTLNK